MFTADDLVWGQRPDETPTHALLRSVFASIDLCLTESGCPLTDEQRSVFQLAIAASA